MNKFGFNLLSTIAFTGTACFTALTLPSLAQTTPMQPTKMMPMKAMTPEQMRQHHQKMMGSMMEMMGKMEQRMSQMTPEQLRQHHQQMMPKMQEMMKNMNQMMEQTKGGMSQSSSMSGSSSKDSGQEMSMPTSK